MKSIPLLIIALFGVATAAPVLNAEPAPRTLSIDRTIPELSVAKAHLASTLSGGLHTKPAPGSQEDGEMNAKFTNSRGGKGWVRIKRRRHMDY